MLTHFIFSYLSENDEFSSNSKRRKTAPFIGYRKLEDLSKIDESDELIPQVVNILEGLEDVCNRSDSLKKDWIEHILRIFYHCGKSSMKVNKKNIYKILSQTEYLYKAGKEILKKRYWAEDDIKKSKIGEYLISIAEFYMELFPNNAVDVPLDRIKYIISPMENTELSSKVMLLQVSRSLFFKNKELLTCLRSPL